MSLVGTRPILQDELLKYELHHRARIAIKPGITGMWQVSGRSDITDFEEVVRLDGCVLTDDFHAVHVRTDSRDGRNQMRGSKYIQSKMGDTYKKVQEDLNAKREVLFSGTSCQVAGLKHFLGKDYDNLICIDIVCHGVPSPVVWDKYLRWQEHKNHGKVVKVDFRNKKDFGWKDHVETIWFDNGKNVSSPIFKNLFYGHMVLRPSCYECPYKSIMHPGDITIADYWGIEKAAPEFDDNKGVSLVLVNNEKADSIFENVKIELKWKSTRIEDSMQPPLKAPFPKPEGREQFWNDVNDKSFSYIARAYGDNGTANYIKKVLRRAKRKIQHLISKT